MCNYFQLHKVCNDLLVRKKRDYAILALLKLQICTNLTFLLFVNIISGLFWIANKLIMIIQKFYKLAIFDTKSTKICIFQTTCRTELTLRSKDAENQDNSVVYGLFS